MKKITQIGFGLVLVMGLVAGLMPAEASCTAARAVTSSTSTQTFFYTPGNPFYPSYSPGVNPGGTSTTYYVNGVFWSVGGGNPVYGLGNDSGYFKGYSFLLANYVLYTPTWLGGGYNYGFPTFVGGPYGSWQIPGIDGCISSDGTDSQNPDAAECNAVLLTDEANSTGYFALLTTPANPGGDFEYTANTGFPAQVNLAPVPKPFIQSSTTVGSQINLTVDVDPGALMPDQGFYLNCAQDEILQGYRIYVREFPMGTEKPIQPDTRAIQQTGFFAPLPAWVPETGVVPIGQPSNITLDCEGADTDYYLCATLAFGGQAPGAAPFELKSCSLNATKIECGPNLADPEADELRQIERGSRGNRVKRTRSGR